MKKYKQRIKRNRSTRHKQTIWARSTGIYAIERNFLC
jgi:hypothetical protein